MLGSVPQCRLVQVVQRRESGPVELGIDHDLQHWALLQADRRAEVLERESDCLPKEPIAGVPQQPDASRGVRLNGAM